MTKYEAIYEELTERVEAGELSLEDAEIINEAAAEKYLDEDYYDESYEDEFDPEEFDEAVDMCVDILLDEDFCETAEEYLDIMDMEMFSEAAKAAPYEKYMSQKAYEKMIVDALKKDTLEIPEKYAGDKKFVRAFTKDVQKAKKAAAIAAAAAAVVGISAAAADVAYGKKNGGVRLSDKGRAAVRNKLDRKQVTPQVATNYSNKRRAKELTKKYKKMAKKDTSKLPIGGAVDSSVYRDLPEYSRGR